MKILKQVGRFKLDWGDNIKESFINLLLRIFNWIEPVQVRVKWWIVLLSGKGLLHNNDHAHQLDVKGYERRYSRLFHDYLLIRHRKSCSSDERVALGAEYAVEYRQAKGIFK
jgi:hypothetical protein